MQLHRKNRYPILRCSLHRPNRYVHYYKPAIRRARLRQEVDDLPGPVLTHVAGDDLIGRTTVDLEDRFFDDTWQRWGVENLNKDSAMGNLRLPTKPVERRQGTLFGSHEWRRCGIHEASRPLWRMHYGFQGPELPDLGFAARLLVRHPPPH